MVVFFVPAVPAGLSISHLKSTQGTHKIITTAAPPPKGKGKHSQAFSNLDWYHSWKITVTLLL